MLPVAIARMSYAECLALEVASETEHEYLNGEVFAMARGTVTHGALSVAVVTALSNALRDRPCRVLSSDVRVRSKRTGLSTYADVTVVCQKIEVDDDEVYRRNERDNWELFVEARRGDLAELTSCGTPIALDVDAIYRDPLAG